MTQSTGALLVVAGQAWALHGTDCTLVDGSGHAVPLLAAGVTTERACICTPPPHEAEQLPMLTNAETTHGTGITTGVGGTGMGHMCVLHESALLQVVMLGQGVPPGTAGRNTLRTIICLPPPHDVVHTPTATNSDIKQSDVSSGGGAGVGHGNVLHVLVWTLAVAFGHALPPLDGGISTVRSMVWLPPPHVAEQTPTGTKPDMVQSTGNTGHGIVLHACVMSRSADDGSGHRCAT